MEKLQTLGVDLGTNSLGWCLIETLGEPCSQNEGYILASGVRIFSDGREAKTGASLAVDRRAARAMRRRRDRYLARRAALLKALIAYGLMPANEAEQKQLLRETDDGKGLDAEAKLHNGVYGLRARALSEALAPYQIGRILFQLDQRRGFKSNRKTDKGDNEAGKIAVGVSRLDGAMAGKTYGQFLHQRRLEGQSVRARLRPETDEDAKGTGYNFYPSRQALEDEFDRICAAQAEFHPNLLGDDRIEHLRAITFYQRPLKAPVVGRCSYNPEEARLAKAHPLFQHFRLLKEVNELAIIGEDQKPRKLTLDQRNALVSRLKTAKTPVKFDALRKTLKLGNEFSFNKESETREALAGDEVYARMLDKNCFGARWGDMEEAQQWRIVQRLRDEEDPVELRNWLMSECGLTNDEAAAAAKVALPQGYGRIGESAARNLLAMLQHEIDGDGKVITEAEAAKRAGYNHSDKRDDDFPGHKQLPNYQEVLARHIPPGTGNPDDIYDVQMGRITNPTVHIALNQLRRVVNAVLRRYGKPHRIAIELGRDLKLSEQKKEEVDRLIRKNTREAEARSEELLKLGQTDNGYNRLRLKLWQELNRDQLLNRVCVYSGQPIGAAMVFSDEVDVDHILPYSATLDDSEGNKILCMAFANRQKRKRAPADVGEWAGRYDEILARTAALPKNKRWRFARDAMEKFNDAEGFRARQLTDMQYVSRLALTYLASIYPTEEAGADGVIKRHSRVRALPGRMTEMLRRKWGLNELLHDHNIAGSDVAKEKNRKDHRHHAIDAAVIACTSRALIQRIQTASGALEQAEAERVVANIELPWPSFREDLRTVVNAIVVSHKPDHGTVSRAGYANGRGQTAGKLHNDTAYGPTGETDAKGQPQVVRRKALPDFKSEQDLASIRDLQLREALWVATRGLSGKDFEQALIAFSQAKTVNGKANVFENLRHIRVLETLQTIPIRDRNGKIFKTYKGDSNQRYDVWRLPDGKWQAEVVASFEAHQPNRVSKVRAENSTAKKILSLSQNDLIAIDDGVERGIHRVVKFSAAGTITLAPHNEAGALKARDADANDPFRYVYKSASSLKAANARQIRIDEIGRVFDPGPRSLP